MRKLLGYFCSAVLAFAVIQFPAELGLADELLIKTRLSTVDASLRAELSPSGEYLYVSDMDAGLVRKVRASDFVQVASISVGTNPWGLAVSAAANIVLVANVGQGANGSISRISLVTDTVVATIPLDGQPADIAITSSGASAVAVMNAVSPGTSFSAAIIDLTDNSTRLINMGSGHAQNVSISPDGLFAYITRHDSPDILKLNIATGIATTAFSVAGMSDVDYPLDLYIDSTYAYVISLNYLLRVRLSDGQLQSRIYTKNASRITVTPNGNFLYVTDWGERGKLIKINTTTFSLVSTTSVVHNQDYGFKSFVVDASGEIGYATFAGEIAKLNLLLSEPQTLTIASIPDRLEGANDLVLSATSSSGFSVVFSSLTPSVCAVTGEVLTTKSVGTCTIRASQNGGSGWDSAQTDLSFNVKRQEILFTPLNDAFDGSSEVTPTTSSNSGLNVSIESQTPTICSTSNALITYLLPGTCTIRASQLGNSRWSPALSVDRSFIIYASPPQGEAGISITNGASYINTKDVSLNLVWPAYATAVRISNDGGFSSAKTSTFSLAPTIKWTLDDSVKGIYTKVVYVRFNGAGIDTTKTYSDDIILDTNPPVVESSTAAAVSGSIDLTLKATDDITGVDKVEIKNGASTVTKDYAAKVSVPLADLLLSVSSLGVQKLAATSIEVRVSDNAGNWTGWQSVTVAGLTQTPTVTTPTVTTPTVTTPTVTTPTVSKSKSATAKSIAIFAKIPVLSTSKVSIKVASGYAKFCKVSGATLKGLKAGICKVVVTVTPKKGKTIPRTVTLKVSN